jgi:hypothetical protein
MGRLNSPLPIGQTIGNSRESDARTLQQAFDIDGFEQTRLTGEWDEKRAR